MPRNALSVLKFSPGTLIDEVARTSCGSKDQMPPQVQYLAKYAQDLGAKTIVTEKRYVDRHFMDEFALYYSRMLRPLPNTVARLHLFGDEFDEGALDEVLRGGFAGVAKKLSYLGFCCVRPLPTVPIGRTIVAQLPDGDEKRRVIWATNNHDAHLANLTLQVRGLPFQQQDAAVGACATAALWSALSRVARQEGMRSPTPAEIAELASRPQKSGSRGPLPPSVGLTVQQLCEVTRACGFSPEVIVADERPEYFAAALHTYLGSGIPVVLALRGSGKGHAVTAVGFHQATTAHPLLACSVPARSSTLGKIYVHDDRLGPYARARLEPFQIVDLGEGLTFEIEMGDGTTERWLVDAAVAPVYPKVRLSMRGLLLVAEELADLVEHVAGNEAFDLQVDFRYQRSGEYLGAIRSTDPAAVQFAREVALSRWCAVIRWSIRDRAIFEFVYDTTDVYRGTGKDLLRAVVSLDGSYRNAVLDLGRDFNVPAV